MKVYLSDIRMANDTIVRVNSCNLSGLQYVDEDGIESIIEPEISP